MNGKGKSKGKKERQNNLKLKVKADPFLTDEELAEIFYVRLLDSID